MSSSKHVDALTDAIAALSSADDWAGLIRFSLVHQVHKPALVRATNILLEKSRSHGIGKYRDLADFIFRFESNFFGEVTSVISDIQTDSKSLFPTELVGGLSPSEKLTVHLLATAPTAMLCNLASKAHPIIHDLIVERGLAAATLCLDLSVQLDDAASQQMYHELIAHALLQSDQIDEGYYHIRMAATLAMSLRRSEPQLFTQVFAGAVHNLSIVLCELPASGHDHDLLREGANAYVDLIADKTESLEDPRGALRQIGTAQFAHSDFVGARDSFAAAMDVTHESAQSRFDPSIADLLYDLACCDEKLNDLAGACACFQASVEAHRASQQEDSGICPSALARSLNALGVIQMDLRLLHDARQSLQESLQIRQTLAADDADMHGSDLTMTLQNIARLEAIEFGGDAGIEALIKAWHVQQNSAPAKEGLPKPVKDDCDDLSDLPLWVDNARKFIVLFDFRWLQRARDSCSDREILKVLQSPGAIMGLFQEDLVHSTYRRLMTEGRRCEAAIVACLSGMRDLSILRFGEFVPSWAASPIDENRLTAVGLFCETVGLTDCAASIFYRLGQYADFHGRYRESITLLRKAVSHLEELVKSGSELYAGELASGLSSLGVVLRTVGENSEAEILLLRAYKLRRDRTCGRDEPEFLANTLCNLGVVYINTERYVYAEQAIKQSIAGLRNLKTKGPEVKQKEAKWLGLLGLVYLKLESFDLAKQILEAALQTHNDLRDGRILPDVKTQSQSGLILNDDRDLIECLVNCVEAQNHVGDYSQAIEMAKQCDCVYSQLSEHSQKAYRQLYALLLNNWAKALGAKGQLDASIGMSQRAIHVAASMRDCDQTDHVWKGVVHDSLLTMLMHQVTANNVGAAFQILASLREPHVAPQGFDVDNGLAAARNTLAEREDELGRKVQVVIAESIKSGEVVLGVLSVDQGLEILCSRSFTEAAAELWHALADVLGRPQVRDAETALTVIDHLGRSAWRQLPIEIQNALRPSPEKDILISGSPYWAMFPWEALRIEIDGCSRWLGELNPLVRFGPLTAGALGGLRRQRVGNNSRTAAIICPWNARADAELTCSLMESDIVASCLFKSGYILESNSPILGQGATSFAVLEAIRKRPSILHFSGHGSIISGEEVLVLADRNDHRGVYFGNVDFEEYKRSQKIFGRFFQHSPLWVLNACFSGQSRSHGGKQEDFVSYLIEEGIAAVVAIPFPIRDDIAAIFAQLFYEQVGLWECSVANAFFKSRNSLHDELWKSQTSAWPMWMLLRLHGNPYAEFPQRFVES